MSNRRPTDDEQPQRIAGIKYLGQVRQGSSLCATSLGIVVTHPDEPPFLITASGSRRVLIPGAFMRYPEVVQVHE